MNTSDNIAAPATALGGAISVIRISGPDALAMLNAVWRGKAPVDARQRRRMILGKVGNEPVLAVYMPAPHSYTGDEVAELHCHGGAASAEQCLRKLLEAGCRAAEPGEFTFRAFVNGKLDLAQAEAVNDLISSGSALAARAAENQLSGRLSDKLTALYDELGALRAECESRLDFPDEELEFDATVPRRIAEVKSQLETLYRTRNVGAALRDGIKLVLAGRPNSGKSSLMNLLSGCERSIVADVPGTTRDTVEFTGVIRGLPVIISDTAGLRRSEDAVEQLGVERSRRAIAASEVLFWLLDASGDHEAEIAEFRACTAKVARIAVWNKIDLTPHAQLPDLPEADATVRISARTSEGVEALEDCFAKLVSGRERPGTPEVAVNARCAGLLASAMERLDAADAHFASGDFELCALHLRQSAADVGAVIGRGVEYDVLESIFKNFCIGK